MPSGPTMEAAVVPDFVRIVFLMFFSPLPLFLRPSQLFPDVFYVHFHVFHPWGRFVVFCAIHPAPLSKPLDFHVFFAFLPSPHESTWFVTHARHRTGMGRVFTRFDFWCFM